MRYSMGAVYLELQLTRVVLSWLGSLLMCAAFPSFINVSAAERARVLAPANLAICVLDNEHYGETGMQETHTGHGVDIVGMAAAAGFTSTATVVSDSELDAQVPVLLETPGPVFTAVKVTTDPVPLVLPPRDGTWLKHRFRGALLGDAAYE